MTHDSIIILISSILIVIGTILLILRERRRKSVVLRDVSSTNPNISSEQENLVKEIIIMDPSGSPDLLRVNGGIIGMKMSGAFERKDAPSSSYASYNCFHILFCPIFPLGCYMIDEITGNINSIHCYAELRIEKDELLFILAKGWGIFLIIVGIFVAIVGLSS